MTGINHKQAQRYLRAAADGLLRENQRALLDAHLRDCDSCRAEADELSVLEARLKKNFQVRWDANDGPSKNVMATIHSRSRRIIMTNRINTGLKTAAGIAALLVLIVFLNSAVGKLRNTSMPASATESTGTPQSIQPGGLIAFVSLQDGGNYEIFTMKADGSELTNLTNNLATDMSPAWSPEGTRIAFTSDRSGDTDIYVMNADGSSLSRLTNDRGYEDYFSWSPDGQRIVYTASENSLNQNERLMVINADGSNKIALMDQPGSYTFLGWSPDGQTIVYQATNLGDTKDTLIMSANVDDGIGTLDGPFFEGDSGRGHYQIHWETPEQFVTLSSNSEQSTWGLWNITRFYTTGDSSRYTSNNPPILATSNSPIVAIFDKTYVVESQDSLSWFVYDGAPIPSSPWNFSDICKTPGDPNLQETSHFISPDKKHSFVSNYCRDDNGSVSFFLMNEDGTEIHQLGVPITNTNSIPGDVSWSPDGKYVTMPIADRQNQDIYLFDIEKMLNDPSTQPVQLTTDGAIKYGAIWQPQLKQEPVVIKATEELSTPEPLTFSLTVQEAETLAGFDVLEPSYLPEGYIFNGASYDSGPQWVVLQFISQPEGSDYSKLIYIYQLYKHGTFDLGPALHPYETPVPIGDVEGIFIRGAYVSLSPDTTAYKWDASADSYALYWRIEDTAFSINFLGGETIPPIPLADLVAIAESMK
jgi:Tol biopolymer transport system component